MSELVSGVLVISQSPKGNFWISGSVYVDIDGTRYVVGVEAKEMAGPIDLTVQSHLDLLCTAAVTQVGDKLRKGNYLLSPRPIEV